MLAITLLLSALAVTSIDCESVSACNRLGTDALKAGEFDSARALFAQQIDRAQTAVRASEDEPDRARASAALQIALNNAALAELRAGDCLRARAWLEVADADHRATQANRRQLQQRCADGLDSRVHTGEFWQYAGHGAWNSISIRETGDETLRLDAFWMRVGRGPLQDYGPAAMGELTQVFLHVDGDRATGNFEANEDAVECLLQVQWSAGGLQVQHSDTQACYTGGAGAVLSGHFWHVGAPAELPDDANR